DHLVAGGEGREAGYVVAQAGDGVGAVEQPGRAGAVRLCEQRVAVAGQVQRAGAVGGAGRPPPFAGAGSGRRGGVDDLREHTERAGEAVVRREGEPPSGHAGTGWAGAAGRARESGPAGAGTAARRRAWGVAGVRGRRWVPGSAALAGPCRVSRRTVAASPWTGWPARPRRRRQARRGIRRVRSRPTALRPTLFGFAPTEGPGAKGPQPGRVVAGTTRTGARRCRRGRPVCAGRRAAR